MKSRFVFVIGARDPEELRIVQLLKSAGQEVIYASVNGVRVNPRNAYRADPIERKTSVVPVWVECRSRDTENQEDVIVDHHRPNDPGYALSYKDFFKASSLGQVINLLGIQPTFQDFVTAATDHCLCDALQGLCPGVPGQSAHEHSIAQTVTTTGASETEIIYQMSHFKKMIREAPTIVIDGKEVLDFRLTNIGVGYSLEYLCLRQVLLGAPHNSIIAHRVSPEEPMMRVVIYGDPNVVIAFTESWAPKNNLVDTFCVPGRRFGGAYLPL